MKKSKYAINVKFETTNFTLFLEDDSSVADLRHHIFKQTTVEPDKQILLLPKSGYLLDSNQKLKNMGIKGNQATIILESKEHKPSFQFNNLKDQDKRNFNKMAPNWRMICPGLYLESKCATKQCAAFSKKVLTNKKFGKFDLGKEIHKCICPICQKKTEKATNLGYYGTKIKIEGIQNDGTEVKIEETIPLTEYRTFSEGAGLVQWSYIEVETSPL